MNIESYVENIKLEVLGGRLRSEIDDETLVKLVYKALGEIQRYIDTTKIITVPFASCIDLGPYVDKDGVKHEGFNCSSVTKVYRITSYINSTEDLYGQISNGDLDPFQAQMWKVFSNNGTMYNLQDYVLNYLAYNTLRQMKNTSSTDMAFKEVHTADKHQLYINYAMEKPTAITIEYVPKLLDVEDVVSDYWIDILKRLSVGFAKIAFGRIRSKYKSSSTLWQIDGETLVTEGREEVADIRETLRKNSLLFYPVD